MHLDVLEGTYTNLSTEVVVLGYFEDEPLPAPVKYFDEVGRLGGFLAKAHQKKQLNGEFKAMRSFPVNTKPEYLLLVGLGKRSAWSLERLRRAAGASAKVARQLGKTYTTNLHLLGPSTPDENAKAVAIGITLGLYEFLRYKTQDVEKRKVIEHIVLLDTEKQKADLVRGMSEGVIIAESVAVARDLINTPARDLTPKVLAAEAKRISKAVGCSVDTWDRKDCEKKGMNAFLGVSQGSDEEPQFIIIEYGPKKQKPIILVGKGVTFDTGGLSIKYPYTAMMDMKDDMSGAAAVIATIRALSLLKVQQHVIGLIPATENAINGKAIKPGDVVKAMNGKTIEVVNTDAEGRLILADALCYAETLQPQAIIDLATLTGACVVALGYVNSGLFTKDERLRERLLAASTASGDAIWPMPLTDDYADLVRSDIADVRNISRGTDSGATVGAIFLERFVEKTPWAHLDIAGPAFINEEKDYAQKGGTGAGIRLLVETIQRWKTLE